MMMTDLSREIEKAGRRLSELRRTTDSGDVGRWADAALAELTTMLEELKVAEEELRDRTDDLARAHVDLQYERNRYRELFLFAPFAQLVTDLQGVITEGNQAAGEMFGTSTANLVGKPLPLFVQLDDRHRFNLWLAELRDGAHDSSVCAECGGSKRFRMHVAGRSKEFSGEITASPMGNRHGQIDAIRWVVRDFTDAERAIEADRLAAATERKDEFIAMLGHELRNPLAAISLASQILTSETPGDGSRQRWAAEVVQRHADHLRQLVDDLLDVSRVSHGKVVLQRGELDLRSVVTGAIESCQPLLASKKHEIRFAPPEQPVRIEGDAGRLRQVLVNLIDNAAKYTPAGGRIEISLEQEPERVTIAVRDNGIGIPPSMVDRIFQLYEQVDGASDEGGQGLGLGLALVQQLVALHGGAVRVESPGKGKGSSFFVTLPTAAGGADPARAPLASGDAQTRVLIVDDNTDAAELLADWLRGLGYSVEVAFDGSSAIAAAPCDIALVDLGLPDLDGFDLGRQLRGGQQALRLVALTGRSDAQARDQAAAAGFDRFLVKPVDPREVFAALRELVDSSDS